MEKPNGPAHDVHAQEFAADWPAVLAEFLEFIVLTQLSLGRGRTPAIKVSLSRERVAADQLQPHVEEFRASLAQQLPNARLNVVAGHHALHRVEVDYGN